MNNVPFYHEVTSFSSALCDARQGEYGLACAHEHSCSVLLANKSKYLRGGEWCTWIDYDKFQDLVAAGKPFTSEEYTMPTPSWAVYGAQEKGFNPNETRVRKVRNHAKKPNPPDR
jgi:tRNA wybutosine-synthesizing protein 1